MERQDYDISKNQIGPNITLDDKNSRFCRYFHFELFCEDQRSWHKQISIFTRRKVLKVCRRGGDVEDGEHKQDIPRLTFLLQNMFRLQNIPIDISLRKKDVR